MKVQFQDWNCDVYRGKYFDVTAALSLTHPEDGPIVTASVYLEQHPVTSPDITWIKTWSENKGIFEALLEAGVIEDLGLTAEVNEFGSVAKLAKILI